MKLGIISTTIHGEKGYLAFDRLARKSKFSEVFFVIAGDKNAAPFDVSGFECGIEYMRPEDQERFSSSGIIGWRTPRRRPIAWLRAIEKKPDYILSIDDDNIPSPDYFDKWHDVLTRPVNKVVVPVKEESGRGCWHNYLASSDAPIEIYPRGFPIPFQGRQETALRTIEEAITPEKIGLFQGISLGDPDIGAMTRLVWPKQMPLKNIGEKNYCLKNVWSPYNTQNTMFSKALFPLPVLWPHAGRFDDIFASFVWQKFLFNNGLYVHVGDPVNHQDRGVRDILNTDFREEVEGYFYSHKVWETINNIDEKDPMAFVGKLAEYGKELTAGDQTPFADGTPMAVGAYSHPVFSRHKWSPSSAERLVIAKNGEFFSAYLKDLEGVMK